MNEIATPCPTCGRERIEYLSPARRRLWYALLEWLDEHDRKPTYDELSEHLDMARSTIHEHVQWFVRKGWMEWTLADFSIYRECSHGR